MKENEASNIEWSIKCHITSGLETTCELLPNKIFGISKNLKFHNSTKYVLMDSRPIYHITNGLETQNYVLRKKALFKYLAPKFCPMIFLVAAKQ